MPIVTEGMPVGATDPIEIAEVKVVVVPVPEAVVSPIDLPSPVSTSVSLIRTLPETLGGYHLV
ncbi:hypothetical protein ACN4EE_06010 [Geminocystis sp. CENA526]|uniref:hypothetical protein n=1 Tax=Geminocystis sp. CENA526 TaxID=1355871 RepID=UPI003D6E3BCB